MTEETTQIPEPASILAYQLGDHERRLRKIEEAVEEIPLLEQGLETLRAGVAELKTEVKGSKLALWGVVVTLLTFTLSILAAVIAWASTQ